MRRACFLVLPLLLGTLAVGHGLHLSIGKSEATDTALTGKLVFNKLDFVEALDQWDSDRPIYELTPEDFEKLTLRYMKRHFKVEANGARDLKLEITEAGTGKETMWLAFRFASPETLRQIRVEHRVLFDVFPDQGNVLEVRWGKGRESHLFRVDDPFRVFQLR